MSLRDSLDNEEVLEAYRDFLSQQRMLQNEDVIDRWNSAARKFAEYIAPVPLIAATRREVNAFHWDAAPGPKIFYGIDVLHTVIVTLREQERLRTKEARGRLVNVTAEEI